MITAVWGLYLPLKQFMVFYIIKLEMLICEQIFFSCEKGEHLYICVCV